MSKLLKYRLFDGLKQAFFREIKVFCAICTFFWADYY